MGPNLRAEGTAELRVGRRVREVTAADLADAEKVAVLRAYLTLWKMEVGKFFDGVGPDSSDGEIAAIASAYPVFKLATAPRPNSATQSG